MSCRTCSMSASHPLMHNTARTVRQGPAKPCSRKHTSRVTSSSRQGATPLKSPTGQRGIRAKLNTSAGVLAAHSRPSNQTSKMWTKLICYQTSQRDWTTSISSSKMTTWKKYSTMDSKNLKKSILIIKRSYKLWFRLFSFG